MRLFAYFCQGKNIKMYLRVCVCVCSDDSLQDVDATEIKVQVCVYAFDLLYLNGEVRPGADEENIKQRSLSQRCHCHLKPARVPVYCVRMHPHARCPAETPTSLYANDGATGSRN